jgi:hypothetical protein
VDPVTQLLGLQIQTLQTLSRMEKTLLANQADLDAQFTAIAAVATQLGTDIKAVIAAIEAKVPPSVDLSAEVAQAQAIVAQLQGLDADTLAANAPAPAGS